MMIQKENDQLEYIPKCTDIQDRLQFASGLQLARS